MNIIDITKYALGVGYDLTHLTKYALSNIRGSKGNASKNRFLSSWEYGRELVTSGDLTSQIRAYKSWVYIFANRNAISISQSPLRLYVAKPSKSSKLIVQTRSIDRETRKYLYNNAGLDSYLRKAVEVEEVLEHPLLDLFKNVNNYRNRSDLFTLTELHQGLTGNCYWYLLFNKLGLPIEIWLVPPDKMRIVPSKEDFISGYIYSKGTEKVPFETSEIVHHLTPDPDDLYYGISPVAALARTYNLSANLEEFQKNLVKNQAVPSGVLKTQQKLDEKQFNALSERWNTKYSGPKNAGKTSVLDSGLEYQAITITPRELESLAMDSNAKEKLCNAFGQSLGLWSENATEANAKVAYDSYMRDTVRAKQRCYEEKINEKVCPLYDDRIFVAYDNPVPEDREYLLKKRDSDLKNFVISPNEAREQDGKEPVKWGEVPLMPFNLMPYSPTKTTSPKSDSGEKTVKKKEIDKEQYWNIFIKKVTPFEKKFTENVRQLFVEQEEKAKVALKKKTVGVAVTKDVEDVLNIPKSEAELRKWTEFFLPAITETVKYNGEQALYELGMEISFNINNPKVVEWIKSHAGEAIKQIQDTTLEKLRTTLAEGVANGESIPDLSKRIAEVYEKAKDYRTDMIARTETMQASNKGTLEGYKQSGLVEKKEWITAIDERSCEECVAMEGEVVEINKAFSCGVMQPPLHPNCRCCIAAVV